MLLYKKREVTKVEETPNFAKIHYANEPDYQVFWVHKSDVIEAPSKSVAARLEIQQAPSAGANLSSVKIVEAGIVSPVFVEALKAVNYRIRILFPPHAAQSIQESFSKAGVMLPADIRPQAVGKRKPDAQAPRSWSATVTFPAFVTPNLLPEGTTFAKGNKGFLIKREIVLALLQAGLVINDYAKG